MPMETLRDLWERNARLFPDSPALVAENRGLTYGQLLNRARQLANALADRGIGNSDRVAVLSMNRIEYMEVLAANHVLGSIAATLNFRLATAELKWILNDCSPRVLIFENRFLEEVTELRTQVPDVEHFIVIGAADNPPTWTEPYEQLISNHPAEPLAVHPRSEDIAHLIYTSGSTGRPKGVMRSHGAEINYAEAVCCGMDVRTDSRILEVMPFFHTGAQGSALAVLWRAGTICVHSAFDAESVLRTVQDKRITHLHLVPSMVQELLGVPDHERFDLSSLETLLYAAAPITPPVLRQALERFGPVFIGAWGMTEGTGTFLPKSAHRPNGTQREVELLKSVGQESQRCRVRIVDEAGKDCGINQPGELLLHTPTLMSGYWNNSRATLETVKDGWLYTGDIGYFDDRFYIYLVDRKKDMIISGGENIFSQEVERALAEHSAIDQAVVIGVPDERWGETVKAIVVLKAGAQAGADDIIEHCGNHIAKYKKPRTVEFVDRLPLLGNGKVDKVALRKQFAGTD